MKKNLYIKPSIELKSLMMESILNGLSKDDTTNAGTGDGTGHNDITLGGPSNDDAGAKFMDWSDL